MASDPIWVCGASPRFRAGASTVSAALAAVPAHLVRKAFDVDRLLEIAGETGGSEPGRVVLEGYRGQRDDGNRRCPRLLGEHPGGVRTVHVREPEVHEDQVWEMFVGERHPLLAGRRRQGAESGRDQDVNRELQVPCVVVDDENERDLPPRRRADLVIESARPYPLAVAIRVVLADDHYLVREGVRSLLEAESELEVVAVCEDLDSLLGAVDAERPDVVVTDIRMPPGNTDEGIQAAERLRETHPGVGVVVLSQYAAPSYVLALLDRGSAGRAYLLKERVEDVEQLVAAIRTVADGGSVIDPKVVDALVAENARNGDSPLNELTPRERDVLREMAEGKNNAAIAESLVLAERSVEKVIHSIFLKLDLTWETAVHRRVKAVILYLAESD